MVRVTVKFKGPVKADRVADISKRAALKATRRTQGRIQRNIRAAGRIDSGRMLQSVTIRREPSHRLAPTFSVGARTPYAAYQEYGTRAHGPKRAPVMVFRPKGGRGFVFAKWVRGVKAAHFVRDAVRRLTSKDFV
jgi:hypothetical protein